MHVVARPPTGPTACCKGNPDRHPSAASGSLRGRPGQRVQDWFADSPGAGRPTATPSGGGHACPMRTPLVRLATSSPDDRTQVVPQRPPLQRIATPRRDRRAHNERTRTRPRVGRGLVFEPRRARSEPASERASSPARHHSVQPIERAAAIVRSATNVRTRPNVTTRRSVTVVPTAGSVLQSVERRKPAITRPSGERLPPIQERPPSPRNVVPGDPERQFGAPLPWA